MKKGKEKKYIKTKKIITKYTYIEFVFFFYTYRVISSVSFFTIFLLIARDWIGKKKQNKNRCTDKKGEPNMICNESLLFFFPIILLLFLSLQFVFVDFVCVANRIWNVSNQNEKFVSVSFFFLCLFGCCAIASYASSYICWKGMNSKRKG